LRQDSRNVERLLKALLGNRESSVNWILGDFVDITPGHRLFLLGAHHRGRKSDEAKEVRKPHGGSLDSSTEGVVRNQRTKRFDERGWEESKEEGVRMGIGSDWRESRKEQQKWTNL
jgi:hypothetical protein